MSGLRGRVVLIDFWTYSCINCLRTLPYLNAWNKRYRKDGLTIVGVHSPEFPFEKDAGNVEDAIQRNGIEYPVVQDNDLATWNAWGNQYWPAEYFVDAKGRVRFADFGEGKYGEKEHVIRELLAEAGRPRRRRRVRRARHRAVGRRDDPGDLPGRRPGRTLHQPDALSRQPRLRRLGAGPRANEFAYRGRWRITLESATAEGGASLDLNFGARRVYVVLGPSGGHSGRMQVLLDGRPIPAAAGRQRRPRRQRRRRLPAPLRAGRPAAGRRPRAHPEAGSGGAGLLVHFRLVRTSSSPKNRLGDHPIMGTVRWT